MTSHVAAGVNPAVKAALAFGEEVMDVMDDLDDAMTLYISHAWMECCVWNLGLISFQSPAAPIPRTNMIVWSMVHSMR